jgi:hypothetical protein
LAESDRQKEERVQELTKRLGELSASDLSSAPQDTNPIRDLDLKLREIQSFVVIRFKSQRALELQKEIKSLGNRDVNKKRLLLLDLKSLNFDPAQESVVPLETLKARVLELHRELEDRKHDLILENDLEASMLCEISRLNLLNFLKVFQLELEMGSEDSNAKGGKQERDEEISKLNEQIFLLRSGLKEKQSEITRYEQKEGVGFKVTSSPLPLPHPSLFFVLTSKLEPSCSAHWEADLSPPLKDLDWSLSRARSGELVNTLTLLSSDPLPHHSSCFSSVG